MVVRFEIAQVNLSRRVILGFFISLAVGSSAWADSCVDGFARFANPTRAKVIADMKSAVASAKMSTIQVKEADGRVILDIGYIQNDDREIVRLLPVGVANGAWDEVACGSVVGPKFTSYLVRIMASAKSGASVKFTGKISPKALIETQIEERAERITNQFTSSGSREPFYWGLQEVRDFRTSFDQLRITEACRVHYGTDRLDQCGPLLFEITPGIDKFVFRKP